MASAFPKNFVPKWSSGKYTVPRSVIEAQRVPLNSLARTAAAEFNRIKNKKRKASSINHPMGFPVQQDPTAPYTSNKKIKDACLGLIYFGKSLAINALGLQPSEVKAARACSLRKRVLSSKNKNSAIAIRKAVNSALKAAKAAHKAAANATLQAMNLKERNQGAGNLKHMANTEVPYAGRNNHNTRKSKKPKSSR